MGGIFISYRRGGNTVTVGALAERLDHHFGDSQVFFDTRLTPGSRYPDELSTRLVDSDVLVAVIHDGWVDEFDRERDKDWVIFEIATALRARKPIVPVLLEDVPAPTSEQLPVEIAELAVVQAARVRGAAFRADVDELVRLLERRIAPARVRPPEPPVVTKPNRLGRRIVCWATGIFLLAPILSFTPGPWWEFFALPAFALTFLLAAIAVLTTTIVFALKKFTYRWEVESGTMSFREAMSKRWILIAVVSLPAAFSLSKIPRISPRQEWQVWFVIVFALGAAYYAHRMFSRYSARDRAWPPPVSAVPVDFRRAANRLHEKLTTDPAWRGPRPRALQREAVSIYLNLAEVRLELRNRASMSLLHWIRSGYSSGTAAYLGCLTSIVALDTLAVVLMVRDSVRFGGYLLTAADVVVALLVTAATTAVNFRADRRDVARWIDELTEWQGKLGPLVFC